jgi:mercuric ion binding protein
MKTIKAFLTIVLIIASISFAQAQDSNPKYRYHDLGFKLAATSNTPAGYGYVSFNSSLVPHDAKYHYHDLGFKSTTNNVPTEYVVMKSDFVIQDAKYHYHDFAYKLTTATITVYGECGFCKQHIENAAKIDGVSSAKWNEKTNLLTVQYNSKITNVDKIQQSEASLGHDTLKYRATDVAYNGLPLCCHYRKG